MSIEASNKNHRRDEIAAPSSTPSLVNSLTSKTREYLLQNIRSNHIINKLNNKIINRYNK